MGGIGRVKISNTILTFSGRCQGETSVRTAGPRTEISTRNLHDPTYAGLFIHGIYVPTYMIFIHFSE
jgi:hypothetical protein